KDRGASERRRSVAAGRQGRGRGVYSPVPAAPSGDVPLRAAHDRKRVGRGRNCAGRFHDFDARSEEIRFEPRNAWRIPVRNCAKPRDEASGAIAAGSSSGTKKRGRKRRGNYIAGSGDSGNLGGTAGSAGTGSR